MIQSCCFVLFLKLWPYSFRIDFFFFFGFGYQFLLLWVSNLLACCLVHHIVYGDIIANL
jgi:hypothetical protein